jgi:hypothetical protein
MVRTCCLPDCSTFALRWQLMGILKLLIGNMFFGSCEEVFAVWRADLWAALDDCSLGAGLKTLAATGIGFQVALQSDSFGCDSDLPSSMKCRK